MKNAIFLIICFSLLQTSNMSSQETMVNVTKDDGNVTVLTTPELSSLITAWARGFEEANQGMNVSVSSSDTELSPADGNRADLLLVTNSSYDHTAAGTVWTMVVGRDIVVPVINAKSPFIDQLYLKGLSSEKLMEVYSGKGNKTWGMLLGNDQPESVHTYLVSDKSVRAYVSGFLGIADDDLRGMTVETGVELVSALQKDPYGIGFCRLTDITDPEKQLLAGNLKLIPIDNNGNGQLDFFEEIYSDLGSFNRGVYIGKYPKSLYGNVFTVAATRPAGGAQMSFIMWILADGQQLLAEAGYSGLAAGEALAKTAALTDRQASSITATTGPSVFEAFIIILAGLAVAGLILYTIFRVIRASRKNVPVFESLHQSAFSEKSLIIPRGIFFDKTHTWAYMEKDGGVRIGIDDFIQHVTGTITRLKMKRPGEKVSRGEPILSMVQNGKQLNICAPVSGTVTAVNDLLQYNSSIINSSPYSDGWVYEIDPDNWIKETRMMIMAEKYSEWIRGEFTRLKDFLSNVLAGNELKLSTVVLQDGGELKESLLEDFGPELWEDFQTGFMDNPWQYNIS